MSKVNSIKHIGTEQTPIYLRRESKIFIYPGL